MGAIIYSYGADRFWIKGKRKTNSDEPVTIPNDTPPINAPEPPKQSAKTVQQLPASMVSHMGSHHWNP